MNNNKYTNKFKAITLKRYIMAALEIEETNENEFTICPSFDDMNLKEDILRGIFGYGFEKPSPIQQKAIPILVKERDIIGQAQSGTGKTATFGIGILQRISFEKKVTQALILVPTRELAHQIKKVLDSIGEYCNISVHACIGGTNVMDDINALKSGQHIVVGTPGRIYDMINRQILILNNLKILVLDEADQMLDRGFKAQIYEIFNLGIPEETQIGLFSATWTPEADEIAKKFMRNPVVIKVQKDALTLDGIKQYKVDVKNEEYKYGVLVDLYRVISIKQAVIFCNLKKKIDEVASKLKTDNLSVVCLHGEMEQRERDKIMKEFRNGTTRILLTTDLLARGIDIQQVSLVINYDIPINKEMYIHRIGRSGRFGRKGVAINFVTDKESQALGEIESHYQTAISELPNDLDSVMNS